MSGGLDSAPVAAIAARELARSGQRLTTISYVFDELTSCDERNYMDQIVEMHGLDAIRFPGDGAWPLSNLATWPVNPNTPMEGLYRGLRDRAYAAALGGPRGMLVGLPWAGWHARGAGADGTSFPAPRTALGSHPSRPPS
jgi:hypothetical protein